MLTMIALTCGWLSAYVLRVLLVISQSFKVKFSNWHSYFDPMHYTSWDPKYPYQIHCSPLYKLLRRFTRVQPWEKVRGISNILIIHHLGTIDVQIFMESHPTLQISQLFSDCERDVCMVNKVTLKKHENSPASVTVHAWILFCEDSL